MFKKIREFILSYFRQPEDSEVVEDTNDIVDKPHKPVKRVPVKKSGIKLTIIKKDILLKKIEENLEFIDELIDALCEKGDYKSHIIKLKDMKVQSYGCTKLVKRMSENAPYYQNTLKLVEQHTNTVRELMQFA